MDFELSERKQGIKKEVGLFIKEHISPFADKFDREECIPKEIIKKVAKQKYLGALIPKDYGGLDWDMISFGILNEEFGKACSSLRSLLTVHGMCSYAIMRWGSGSQKEKW